MKNETRLTPIEAQTITQDITRILKPKTLSFTQKDRNNVEEVLKKRGNILKPSTTTGKLFQLVLENAPYACNVQSIDLENSSESLNRSVVAVIINKINEYIAESSSQIYTILGWSGFNLLCHSLLFEENDYLSFKVAHEEREIDPFIELIISLGTLNNERDGIKPLFTPTEKTILFEIGKNPEYFALFSNLIPKLYGPWATNSPDNLINLRNSASAITKKFQTIPQLNGISARTVDLNHRKSKDVPKNIAVVLTSSF